MAMSKTYRVTSPNLWLAFLTCVALHLFPKTCIKLSCRYGERILNWQHRSNDNEIRATSEVVRCE